MEVVVQESDKSLTFASSSSTNGVLCQDNCSSNFEVLLDCCSRLEGLELAVSFSLS